MARRAGALELSMSERIIGGSLHKIARILHKNAPHVNDASRSAGRP
jgi:hypothetical protein